MTDFHREVSLALLRSSPGFAVRTPRGQKDPGAIQWDPKNSTRERSNQNIKTLETTNDNLGIHLFGPVVDVDIDSDNPHLLAALDYFLPPTPHVWGRRSRPRTHRLYELSGANASFDPSQFPFLNKVQGHAPLSVEVRGGEMKSGRYTLLPGSTHPSGEIYEWHDVKAARSSPVQVDVVRLLDAVRKACVVALMAPYWVEGVRNELCKALCGFMYRAAQYSTDLNSGMVFDEDMARSILQGLLSVADDDEADYGMRMQTFDATWEKGKQNVPIVGATRVKEITDDPNIVRLLYILLAHTEELQHLDALFEQYAVVRNTVNIVDLALGARGSYVMNREAFMATLAGRYLTTPSGKVPMSVIFLNSLQRTVVDQLGLDPEQSKVYTDEEGLTCANLWTGFNIPPHDGPVSDEDVAPFLTYIDDVICRNDPKLREWVLTWLADIFQNPATKPGTMLVLVGEQGAGKSVLAEDILRPIIGEAHFIKVSTQEKLTSKFNMHMAGKLVIQGEEVLNTKRRMDNEAMKDMITSRKRSVEPKGKDVIEMTDVARYILTSNHEENAVNVGKGDRRSTIVKVADTYAYKNGTNEGKRGPFWGAMYDWLQTKNDRGRTVPNTENLAKIHRWLLNYPVQRATIRVAFETEVKRATRINSSKGIDAWLLSIIEMESPMDTLRDSERGFYHSFVFERNAFKSVNSWPEYVQYSKLEQAYNAHPAARHGETATAQQLAKYFRDHKMVRDTVDHKVRVAGDRIRVRPFPSRSNIIKYLEAEGYPVLQTSVDDTSEDDIDEGPGF